MKMNCFIRQYKNFHRNFKLPYSHTPTLSEPLPVCLPYECADHGRKGFHGIDQQARPKSIPKKTLNEPSGSEPLAKESSPSFLISAFHGSPGNLVIQETRNGSHGNLGRVQGHTHSVPAKRGNHAGCITDAEHMIFDLGFWGETELCDRDGFVI